MNNQQEAPDYLDGESVSPRDIVGAAVSIMAVVGDIIAARQGIRIDEAEMLDAFETNELRRRNVALTFFEVLDEADPIIIDFKTRLESIDPEDYPLACDMSAVATRIAREQESVQANGNSEPVITEDSPTIKIARAVAAVADAFVAEANFYLGTGRMDEAEQVQISLVTAHELSAAAMDVMSPALRKNFKLIVEVLKPITPDAIPPSPALLSYVAAAMLANQSSP